MNSSSMKWNWFLCADDHDDDDDDDKNAISG